MSEFLYEVNEEKFRELSDLRFKDNAKVCDYLHSLIENNDDRRFNFTILNLGEVMKICAIELEFKKEEIEKYLKLDKEQIRDRRMNNIIKELNQKLNMRFNFSEDIQIISCLYTYKGVGYIYIDKENFCNLLNEVDISIKNLENI